MTLKVSGDESLVSKPQPRKIFYNNEENGKELALMQKIRGFLAADDLPFWWRKGDTLRFAHVAKFDAKKTSVVRL